MRRILVISSYVAKGAVGLQATLPALSSAGRTQTSVVPIAVPTIVLSNHPGFKACAGAPIAPETLEQIIDAIASNGWLGEIAAVMTGYLPSAAHVAFAKRTVNRIKGANPEVLYLADPVIGDDPSGLYIGSGTAAAIRDWLLPLADIVSPNRFELSWLSAMPVKESASAITAARVLGVPITVATSIPDGSARLANVLVSPDLTQIAAVERLQHAPHGTGDYFAGALLAQILGGASSADAVRTATDQTARLLAVSGTGDDLETSVV